MGKGIPVKDFILMLVTAVIIGGIIGMAHYILYGSLDTGILYIFAFAIGASFLAGYVFGSRNPMRV